MSDQTLFDRPFIGYDGSKNCHQLITVFSKMHHKFQSSTFVFVYNPLKNFIPLTSRGPGIQKQILEKTSGLKNINIRIVEKQQGSNKVTNQYLLDQLFKSKSTFIMLGFYGSKGEKVRSIDLSSRIRQFVYDSKSTVAIIKKQYEGKQSVLYCCDGSQVSYEGLKKAFIFCKKFGYQLIILHVYNQQTKLFSKQVKNEIKYLTDDQKNIKIQICIQKQNLIKSLQLKIDKLEWIITCKNGYRGQISKKIFIGSNTTQILTKINCNLIIL